MRIIAGSAKGRRLFSPKSKEIRPALDQVKESVFNILFDVQGLNVLDLFAGTGAMGIEALSRGALRAVFIDNLAEAVALIEKNLDACGFSAAGQVLNRTVGKAIHELDLKGEKFDLIFVDPPYLKKHVQKTLEKLAESHLIHPQTRVVVEHHPKEKPQEIEGLVLTDQRKYGQTLVSFFKKP